MCKRVKTSQDTVGKRSVLGLADYASGSANVSLLTLAFIRFKT